MSEESQKISIDDKEYAVENLTEEQIRLVNLITKSNQRENDLVFDVEQLRVARQIMLNELKTSLADSEETVEE